MALGLDFGGPVEVLGDTAAAVEVRGLLAERQVAPPASSARPAAVIDFTGEAELIVAALARLRDLGTLVLAADPAGAPPDVDLYRDVHSRGLRVVGAGD